MGFFRRKKQIELVLQESEIIPEPEPVFENNNELIAVITAAVYLLLESEKQRAVPSGPPAPFFLRPRKA